MYSALQGSCGLLNSYREGYMNSGGKARHRPHSPNMDWRRQKGKDDE